LQFGSMSHTQAKKNIELFAREVLPHLQKVWEDKFHFRARQRSIKAFAQGHWT
jgi:hypothetical protein